MRRERENAMIRVGEWIRVLKGRSMEDRLTRLYGPRSEEKQRRLCELLEKFADRYGEDREAAVFSVPGRSELAGNHTDHNHGLVIAASVDPDIIAVAAPRQDRCVCVESDGFDPIRVDLSAYREPKEAFLGSSASLVAGVARGWEDRGFRTGGFDAIMTSDVLRGSGLSSSAAFEVMIGTILNHLYNDGAADPMTVAQVGQWAENRFFGKPCGLMDQCACAIGGVVALDFADPEKPVAEPVSFDLTGAGYALCMIHTGGSHADLTADYAAIPSEMKAVAAFFGKDVLREVREDEVLAALPALRGACGDRAVLRALHFFAENRRVTAMKEALFGGNLPAYFAQVRASGRSSFCYLQNVYAPEAVREQGLSLAICLAARALEGEMAAVRVHGGGFAGTVQAYVPMSRVKDFSRAMDAVFGEGACRALYLRPEGAVCLVPPSGGAEAGR